MRCLPGITALVLVVLAGRAVGDDAAPALSAEAQAVLEAVETGGAARLPDLLDDPRIPPFPIAHELVVHGHVDAALAYAGAGDRPELLRLRAYLKELRRRRPSMVDWRRKTEAWEHRAAGRWFELSEVLRDVTVEGAIPDVTGVSLLYAKADAAQHLDRPDVARGLYFGAGRLAESIGWLAGADEMYRFASDAASAARDYGAVLAARERLLQLWTLTEDRERIAEALLNLGSAHANLESYKTALQYYQSALDQFGDLARGEVRVYLLAHMGRAHLRRGHLAPAQRLLAVALEEAEALNRADLLAMVEEYSGEAALHVRQFVEAEAHLRSALRFHESQDDARKTADLHGHLGLLAWWQGKLDDAEAEWTRAQTLYLRALDPTGAARALVSRASVLRRRGGERELRDAYGLLFDLLRGLDDQSDPVVRRDACDEISLVCRARRDSAKALSYRHWNLSLARSGRSLEAEIRALAELAWLYIDQERWEPAVERAREAAELLGPIFEQLPLVQASLTRARLARVYEAGLTAAFAMQDVDQICYFLEAGRAGALLAALEGRDEILDHHTDPALRAQADEARIGVAVAQFELQDIRAAVRTASGEEFRRLTEEVRDAKRRRDRAKDASLAVARQVQLSGSLAADVLQPQPLSREAIQGLLVPGDVLVTYGIHGGDSLIALVLGAEEERVVSLGSAADADARVLAVLKALEPDTRSRPDVDGLRKVLVDPLRVPRGTGRVFVSPVGRIAYLPPVLLFPDRDVVYVPSATTLARLEPSGTAVGEGVLAVGDVVYEASARPSKRIGGELLRDGSRGDLPATGDEARAVGTTVLVREDATETRVREALARPERWRSVHFACHGRVNERRPSYSALEFTPSGEDDGYLYVHDVFQLHLNTDLAVLSACETGRGRLVKAEGVVGLSSAFLVAGAPRVLVSLWRVEDKSTELLMRTFYELYNPSKVSGREPLPAARALRQAQRAVETFVDPKTGRAKWAHPTYWAGWALWGAAD